MWNMQEGKLMRRSFKTLPLPRSNRIAHVVLFDTGV